jgi:hypothetical protein
MTAVEVHLQMIQAVIARMNSNSFALKALAGTITAASLAFSSSGANALEWFPLLILGPVWIFWLLDSHYLHQERCFVELYNSAAAGGVGAFSMDFGAFRSEVPTLWRTAWSWSLRAYYFALTAVLIITWAALALSEQLICGQT